MNGVTDRSLERAVYDETDRAGGGMNSYRQQNLKMGIGYNIFSLSLRHCN